MRWRRNRPRRNWRRFLSDLFESFLDGVFDVWD
ncbi:hypothetical protein [Mycobacterium phage MS810]|uniref:Uncharacterized protein n=1 Tax=Mycobacterium phage GuuelaD TaxID=2015819 RepID=A0A286MQJ0_9CAUD|nr:hypothetical protein J4T97_gp081 [Mycobacterium phage GuuelaD]ALY07404.1 hypothetical protein SEA_MKALIMITINIS3_84 [Mycobacterium phage MkaliMitinis3]AOT22991.1 hypothetical protein SEA_ZAKAI_84 [Mycobacterium phage Zakai]AOT23119.1 hypothetical protein SEA_WILDER_84 [Mycobacterium phage Wilder]AYD84449.1 hypothetical protein SEA_LILDESTINE_82 [Mycobacterium phage LilDestine]QDH92586.1 hypothetical protein SEA_WIGGLEWIGGLE_82 [Mycobacterium phage Wigglewiggle]QDK03882.1 hypothetical protei